MTAVDATSCVERTGKMRVQISLDGELVLDTTVVDDQELDDLIALYLRLKRERIDFVVELAGSE